MENNKWAVEELNSNMEGYTLEERKQYLQDLSQYGCISGMVTGTIYHADNEKLFKDNLTDILHTVDEYAEETGFNMLTKIVEDDNTINLHTYLVWFVVELVGSRMLAEIEEKEEEEA